MKPDLKILFVTPSYKPAFIYGGPTVSVSELAEALVRTGCSVTVYTTTANGREELDVPVSKQVGVNGVSVYYFKRITKDHTHISPALWQRLFNTCRQFDVIHFQSWWSLLMFGAAAICRIRGMNYIVSPRGMLSQYTFLHQNNRYKRWLHKLVGRRLLRSSILHATTPLEWEDCQLVEKGWKGFIEFNIVTLPAKSRRAHTLANGTLNIGFLSRIDRKKGIEILFHALSKVSFSYHLHIAGSGEEQYLAELKVLAAKLNIDQHITWQGWKKAEDKFDFLNEIDLFALPSYNENFANSVIESLAVGCPVLVSNKVGLFDYVRSRQLGWICTPDADSVYEQLTAIAADRAALARINREAPDIIAKDFDKNILANKYQNDYRSVYLETV